MKLQQERKSREREREMRAILKGYYRELDGRVIRGLHSIRANGIRCRSENILGMNFEEIDSLIDIDFLLTQMMASTRRKISDAIEQLDKGAYGYCNDCKEEINVKRLQALPFAIRCKTCEETNERNSQRRRLHSSFFIG